MNNMIAAILAACIISVVVAECPSACSGHGTCGAYDACSCFRNWMSNDCSERICPFGLAHVDTPMGDLDASSGQLTDAATTVIVNDAMYPQGTTEQFPAMKDTAGGLKTNSAHYYRECSNKGMCDRSSGECECFEGYDGSSCQRASCPVGANGVCSGHGTCETISELAGRDNENIYRLWDEDITMGCHCDAGYTGPDCASRSCKVGTDPLYYDDFQNIRYSNQTVQFYIMNDDAEIYGNYSLVFTDVYGEDWQTEPIDIDASCAVIQDRLESLPNDVIPYGTVKCYKSEEDRHVQTDTSTGVTTHTGTNGAMDPGTNNAAKDGQKDAISVATNQQTPTDASYTISGAGNTGESIFFAGHYAIVNKFVLAFSGNPGDIAPLKVNRFLDGKRPTLFSTETIAEPTLGVHIYSDGFHGETTDYVNDECEGVLVSLSSAGVAYSNDGGNDVEKYTHNLKFSSNIEFERLKRCLGDSDGVTSNNVEVYDWDYGTFMNPHLIKLVDATQDRFTEYIRADGSSYKVLDAGKTPAGGGDGWENFPMTKLCARSQPWQNDNYMGLGNEIHPLVLDNVAATNLGTYGWCRDTNPPGFFAILYFDDCTAGGVSRTTTFLNSATTVVGGEKVAGTEGCAINKDGFRLLTRPATDYADNTKFHVFTTKGTLQQVSQQSEAYTTSHQEKLLPHKSDAASFAKVNPKFVHNFHSNVIHVKNVDSGSGQGEIDCETAAIGTKNNFDCLNKGDKIFLVNLGTRVTDKCSVAANADMHGNVAVSSNNCFYKATADSFASNPKYPNMYTVKKIAYIPKDPNQADSPEFNAAYIAASTGAEAATNLLALHAAGYRHQITLDMGVNTMYMANLEEDTSPGAAHTANGAVTDPETTATIYKFHPPTLATTGSTGYEYVGECSNRGICDSDEGMCECFGGYTGDDCGKINSLAQ